MSAPAGAPTRRLVLGGSAWLLVGIGVQAGLGFTFWLLGARIASPSELGRASALYTGIQFVNFASGLGLTVVLARDAVGVDLESDRRFGWAVLATVASSALAGTAFLAVSAGGPAGVLASGPLGWAVFDLYTAGTSVALLVDVRLMAARRWGWLVGRIAVIGLVRLPLVLVSPPVSADRWLYHLMVAPAAVGGLVALGLLPRAGAGRFRVGPVPGLATFARDAGVNWAATVVSQAPQFALPVLVVRWVAPEAFAGFFLAWTVTGLLLLAPAAIAQVLLIEGSRAADGFAGREVAPSVSPVDPTVRRIAVTVAVAAAVGAVIAREVAGAVGVGGVLGGAAELLPGLVAGGVPWAATAVWLTEARLRRDHLATIAVTGVLGVAIVGLAWRWVPGGGVGGAVRAWCAGQAAAALVAAALTRWRG